MWLVTFTKVNSIIFKFLKLKYNDSQISHDVRLTEEQTFKGSLVEILLLTKICLTCLWFWLPVFFTIFLYLQILMFFLVHPLTIFIAPTALSLYTISQEKKRLEARYNLKGYKKLSAPYLLGIPHSTSSRWDIEKRVEEYGKWIQKEKRKSR